MFDEIRVELCDHWGGSKQIAHQAWASTYDMEKLEKKEEKDIRRVVSDVVTKMHGTPKERVWMDFFITCPIYIERQFDKYRMTIQYQGVDIDFLMADMGRENITQNELSGRYRTIPDRFIAAPPDVVDIVRRCQAEPEGLPMFRSFIDEEYHHLMEHQYRTYQLHLTELKNARDKSKISANEYKRAREFLRGQLGTGFLTDMRILCNLNSFEWIITQRLAADAQLEGRVVAYRMLKAALADSEVSPTVEKMIEHHGWEVLTKELEASGV